MECEPGFCRRVVIQGWPGIKTKEQLSNHECRLGDEAIHFHSIEAADHSEFPRNAFLPRWVEPGLEPILIRCIRQYDLTRTTIGVPRIECLLFEGSH
jgi:hypothetical protein